MKHSLVLIFVSLSLILGGCDVGGRVEVKNDPPTTTSNGVVHSINRGKIPLGEGLGKLRQDLNDAELEDEQSSHSDPARVTVQDIAENFAQIKRGTISERLSIFLELEVTHSQVEAVFRELNAKHLHRFENRNIDAFLVRFLLVHNNRVESEEDKIALYQEAKEYFRQRIAIRFTQSSNKLNCTRVIREYAGLAQLVAEDSVSDIWFLDAFLEPCACANFKNVSFQGAPPMTIAGLKVLLRVLVGFTREAEKSHVLRQEHLENSFDLVQTFVDKFESNITNIESAKMSYQLLEQAVDALNYVFDEPPSRIKGMDLKNWIAALDQRFYRNNKIFRETLTNPQFAVQVTEIHQRNTVFPRHPLTKIYFNRALIELGWVGPLMRVLTTRPEQIAVQQEYADYEDRFFSQIAAYSTTAHPDSIASQEMLDYRHLFYQVEAKRYFLEETAAKKMFRPGIVMNPMGIRQSDSSDGSDFAREMVAVYRGLRNDLESALTIRLKTRPVEGFQELPDNVRTLCRDEKPGDVLVSICRWENRFSVDRTGPDQTPVLNFTLQGRVSVAPGIYVVPPNTTFHIDEIEFHPLAMFRAAKWVPLQYEHSSNPRFQEVQYYPEKNNIRLYAKKAYDPWIDVSGYDAEPETFTPPQGRPPDIHFNVALVLPWSEDYDIVAEYPYVWSGEAAGRVKLCMHHGGVHCDRLGDNLKGERKNFRYCDQVASQGAPPASPPAAPSGTPAADFFFEIPQENLKHFPLIAAFGGNGLQGFQAGRSPLCPNDSSDSYERRYYHDPLALYDGHALWKQDFKMSFTEAKNIWVAHSELPRVYFDLKAGDSGRGGDAAKGGAIKVSVMAPVGVPLQVPQHQQLFFIQSGQPGAPGPLATCGPSSSLGPWGSTAETGTLEFSLGSLL